MKVNGLLERAQLELITSNPSGSLTGRIYANILNAASAIPYFHNGTAWLPILLGQTSALITQNSGKSVTIDWSTGLFQQVTLTDHAVISFSNPQSGKLHYLTVTQAPQAATFAASTTYVYSLNMTDQDSRRLPYQPVGNLSPGNNRMHVWFYSATVKAGYATLPQGSSVGSSISSPATASLGGSFSPDGAFFASGTSGSPFQSFYQIVDGPIPQMSQRNVVTPTTAAGTVTAVAYNPIHPLIHQSNGTTPFIQTFFLDRYTAAGAAIANPGTLPAGVGQCVAVHPNGYYVGVGHTTTPFASFYPVSVQGHGTKISNPATLPAAQVNSMAFSPTGDFVAMAGQTTPFLQVWPFTVSSPTTAVFGSIVANPGTLPTGGPAGSVGKGVAWRPQGDFIAMATTTSPFLYMVPFNRATATFGTPITTPTLSGAANCVQWSPDGQYLYVGTGTAPFFYIYDFSASTFVAVSFDSTGPGQIVNDLTPHPNGESIVFSYNASPWYAAWQIPTKARNYIKLTD